jgi:hypothetical protein
MSESNFAAASWAVAPSSLSAAAAASASAESITCSLCLRHRDWGGRRCSRILSTCRRWVALICRTLALLTTPAPAAAIAGMAASRSPGLLLLLLPPPLLLLLLLLPREDLYMLGEALAGGLERLLVTETADRARRNGGMAPFASVSATSCSPAPPLQWM